MKILVTGPKGFIGKNLIHKLREDSTYKLVEFSKEDRLEKLESIMPGVDAIVHLAGVNRPKNENDFNEINVKLTKTICQYTKFLDKKPIFIYASSSQANQDNPYGKSKYDSEVILKDYAKKNGTSVTIYRLPGVFGKWCRPNYNSVVATYCHNIANDIPIKIDDPDASVSLVYIDDVIDEFISRLGSVEKGVSYRDINPQYSIKLKELAENIYSIKEKRASFMTGRVGGGFGRCLYATFLSYIKKEKFNYDLPKNEDQRGTFVEMLKTEDSGQISYFTVKPNVTRGGHYHHTKVEKFLIVQGDAKFTFKNILTGETHEIVASSKNPEIVETVPGWAHKVKNVGAGMLIAIIWANENFNINNPDTFNYKF